MADVRNFRKYVEELAGNNYLKKKVVALERRDRKLEKLIKQLQDEVKLLKTYKSAPLPKKKGRRPRPMIKIIETEMGKKSNGTMKVTDIVKMLKQKKVKSNAMNMYATVASSLNRNPKFEKVGKGVFKLVGGAEKPAAKAKKKAKSAKKKKKSAKK